MILSHAPARVSSTQVSWPQSSSLPTSLLPSQRPPCLVWVSLRSLDKLICSSLSHPWSPPVSLITITIRLHPLDTSHQDMITDPGTTMTTVLTLGMMTLIRCQDHSSQWRRSSQWWAVRAQLHISTPQLITRLPTLPPPPQSNTCLQTSSAPPLADCLSSRQHPSTKSPLLRFRDVSVHQSVSMLHC